MSSKRRLNVKALDDEAAVVAPIDFWSRLEELFEQFAKDNDEDSPNYAQGWRDAKDHVRFWVEKTKAPDID